MLFNSPAFLFVFLPSVLAGLFLLGRAGAYRAAAAWLGVASLVFYGWGSPARVLLVILISIAFNYGIGRWLAVRPRRSVLFLGVGANLAALGWYKYANFVSLNLIALGVPVRALHVMLPVGISFFTFTQIAFLVDVYRGQAREYRPLHYVLFVTFFPHLVAGPILHHSEMMPQFAQAAPYRANTANLALGLSWFVAGMFKKVVLADGIAGHADLVFHAANGTAPLDTASAWLGALSYTLQLYFDFSGYSDMAIGLALMMGITFPLNFFSPYKAASLIEFWRRWHMTLSRFLRDYLYIPLGGSRHGPARRLLNLFITMLLGGLWHGAAWTFVLWGALHGAGLAVNHMWRGVAARSGLVLPPLLGQALTLLAVVLAWVPFRAETMAASVRIWSAMVTPSAAGLPVDGTGWAWVAALSAIALLAPNTAEIFGRAPAPTAWQWRPTLGTAAVLGLCLGLAVSSSIAYPTAFLYFRF